jgi:hypothetical protein
VLDRANTYGTVSNVLGDCNASSTSTFDSNTGVITVNYALEEYMNNPMCSLTGGDPYLFGYNAIGFSKDIIITVDSRSVMTASTISQDLLYAGALQITDEGVWSLNETTSYKITSYVDPRYPGMKPVFCILLNTSEPAPGYAVNPRCLVVVGNMYALPVFNHAGADYSQPVPCNCSEQIPLGVRTNRNNQCTHYYCMSFELILPELAIY